LRTMSFESLPVRCGPSDADIRQAIPDLRCRDLMDLLSLPRETTSTRDFRISLERIVY
jgi:hypothetical protein